MKLTVEQVRHVANLARLELSAAEEGRFVERLQAVVDAVDALSKIDTTGVPPTTSVVHGAPTTRTDQPGDMLTADEALANAPQKVGTSFAIPRVLE
jgi:aspartyl-tRNA(Asn)/glutamyl-tRNA(Gln) amidotransferase subunit C